MPKVPCLCLLSLNGFFSPSNLSYSFLTHINFYYIHTSSFVSAWCERDRQGFCLSWTLRGVVPSDTTFYQKYYCSYLIHLLASPDFVVLYLVWRPSRSSQFICFLAQTCFTFQIILLVSYVFFISFISLFKRNKAELYTVFIVVCLMS